MKNWAASTFRSMAGRNFRLWMVGSTVSNIGSWIQRIAQDWLVLTQLTDHSASAVGIITALQFAPQLLLLPWTGTAVDRLDQRKLLIFTQAAAAALAIALALLTVLGIVELWHVYIFGGLFGCVMAFDTPARQSFVSELVDRPTLSNAVALNSISFNGARMIGPAIAGFLIAAVGTGWAFMANGLSFLAVLISLLFLRPGEMMKSERAGRGHGGIVKGLQYVWNRRDLRVMMIMQLAIGTLGLNFGIWIAAMAVKEFATDANGFGLLTSMMAIGTVIGGVIAAHRAEPRFKYQLTGAWGFALSSLAAALAPGFWTFGIALGFFGISLMTFMNTGNALVQLTTDPMMRGRVMAIRMAVTVGGTPIGAPIVGWIADEFGARWSIGSGMLAGLIAGLVGLQYYLTRKSRMPRGAHYDLDPPQDSQVIR